MSNLKIRLDDLSGKEIAAFLEEHLENMRSISPPESKHALDLDSLRSPDIYFWTMWENEKLVGCGALKVLSIDHGEIKSMRIDPSERGRGLASKMLKHIILHAKAIGQMKLSLETGSMDFFLPARELYAKNGFTECQPFGNYRADPNSVFMELKIN